MTRLGLPTWTIAFPVAGLIALAVSLAKCSTIGVVAAKMILMGAVITAVHHAEVVAHRVGGLSVRWCWRSR